MIKPIATKYVFRIRIRNGLIVDNLQINGVTETEAKRKLQQMYPSCEILDARIVMPKFAVNLSYQDVINLISRSD